jgi:hypothetical protein
VLRRCEAVDETSAAGPRTCRRWISTVCRYCVSLSDGTGQCCQTELYQSATQCMNNPTDPAKCVRRCVGNTIHQFTRTANTCGEWTALQDCPESAAAVADQAAPVPAGLATGTNGRAMQKCVESGTKAECCDMHWLPAGTAGAAPILCGTYKDKDTRVCRTRTASAECWSSAGLCNAFRRYAECENNQTCRLARDPRTTPRVMCQAANHPDYGDYQDYVFP